jgi:hypothetical protein
VLKELESSLYKMIMAEGLVRKVYSLDLGLLPLNLQIALKEAAEVVITAILNRKEYKEVKKDIGYLFVTCDLRAADVIVNVDKRLNGGWYSILYFCKFNTDDELELWIAFDIDEDELGKYLDFHGYIHQIQ